MKEKGKSRGISRREFLKDAGLVVGGAAVGAAITYPLVPKAEEVVEVIKEVEVTKYKCPYCGATVDTFDALKSHVTAQHPAEAIPEEVPKYVCPYCSAEFDTFAALKAHATAEHPPGVVEPAFEPEETHTLGLGFSNIGHATISAAVDVKNGRIVRIRPTHYDWKYPELKPWTFEARGKVWKSCMKSAIVPFQVAYKKRAYSPNRIKYPLKRVDWDPDGERNTQNRGISKFKRITWDEATDIIASELKRIVETYGGPSILCMRGAHGQTRTVHSSHRCNMAFLRVWLAKVRPGLYTELSPSPVSWEGSAWGAKHVWGFEVFGQEPQVGLLKDTAENTEMIMRWGCDLECKPWMTSGQTPSLWVYWLKELGIKSVYICPDVNSSVAVHADKWIPVLPNTDAALALAIAYTWMTEGTYDKDYIATHAVGFDKFEDYVLGREDGVAKTPEWASPLCGVPEWTIKALAREWASKVTSVGHATDGGGQSRAPYCHENKRLEVCLLAMQGVGKPGVHQVLGVNMPDATVVPSTLAAYQGEVPETELRARLSAEEFIKVIEAAKEKQYLPEMLFEDGILNPPVSWYAGGVVTIRKAQFVKSTYPREGFPEVHMVWSDSPCRLAGCASGGNRKLAAVRSPKLEFVLTQHPWMENDCLYSDIILPVNSKFESYDIAYECEQFNTIMLEPQVIQGIGESKSDYEAVCEIAKKLDFYDELTQGKSVEEWVKAGFDHSGWEDLTSWEELNEKGYVVQGPDPDWETEKPAMEAFYEDPEGHPLLTPTGKIEFESTGLKENFPDDKERPPVPHWVPGGPGWTHDELLWGERAKKYPLLMVSNTPKWRIHAEMDDIPWTREVCKVKGYDGYMYEPVWVNPVDAAKRGIESGDIVKIYNERGAILGGAIVIERVISGAVVMDHGSRLDPITDELDRGGSTNTICPHLGISKYAQGLAPSGYLVEVEKVSGDQMDEWRKNYPEAFAREYDPACGLRFNAWVEGGL